MVRVTTRCRVDLAGGTLDIWPIGLLHAEAATVNVAIDLPVRVALARRASGWTVRQGGETIEASRAEALLDRPRTALVGLVAAEHGLAGGELELESGSPAGAGLGASSALTVALLAAFEMAETGHLQRTSGHRAAVARDLEARLMGLPTGRQDHFPAQLGGALALEHRPGEERVRRLAVDLDALGERLLVAFTGQSHFSAGNNWQVIRRRLEGDREVIARLDRIRDAARRTPAALEASDWPAVGAAMESDWEARQGLAPEIPTPAIERLLAAARAAGAWGGKACGAGGGGCIAVLAPPSARAAIEARWRELGAALLDARPTVSGLETADA